MQHLSATETRNDQQAMLNNSHRMLGLRLAKLRKRTAGLDSIKDPKARRMEEIACQLELDEIKQSQSVLSNISKRMSDTSREVR